MPPRCLDPPVCCLCDVPPNGSAIVRIVGQPPSPWLVLDGSLQAEPTRATFLWVGLAEVIPRFPRAYRTIVLVHAVIDI
jgi:hypothetical protein